MSLVVLLTLWATGQKEFLQHEIPVANKLRYFQGGKSVAAN